MSDGLLESARRAHELGHWNEAARLYAGALRADPRNVDALNALGRLHYEQRAFEDSRRLFGEAVRLNPQSVQALSGLGMALLALHRAGQALASFESALSFGGAFRDALLGRANALRMVRRYVEAVEAYDAFLAANPDSGEAWHNRGVSLCELRRLHEAIASLSKAIELAPQSAQSWHNRGLAHTELKDFQAAARDHEKAFEFDPDIPFARGYLIFAKLSGCNWREIDADREAVKQSLGEGKPVIVPFGNVMVSHSPADQRLCAEMWMRRYAPPPPPLWRGERYRHARIRVAYVSGDFRQHPVGYLMAGVFEHHDKARFETIGVSFGHDDKSGIRRRVAGSFDRFVDARTKSDLDVATLLRTMEVDIAVDLMGPTADCRAGIFSCRPAPVQVNFLGYPGTMGCPFMDYIIADRCVIPPEDERHYSERIAFLPDTYFPTDNKHPIAGRVPARSEAGLPDSGIVFCAFNNGLKYGPEIFASWMRILAAVPRSVLWLPQLTEFAQGNLHQEAKARCILPERILFAPYVKSQADHIGRLSLADMLLDTLPCNAHTNAADALWAGVPVVTCRGETFAGRVAASQLRAIGLEELVTATISEYEALAIALAQDPPWLTAIRAKLAQNKKTQALFDTERYTRNLERAFTEMTALASRGERPRSFDVAETAS